MIWVVVLMLLFNALLMFVFAGGLKRLCDDAMAVANAVDRFSGLMSEQMAETRKVLWHVQKSLEDEESEENMEVVLKCAVKAAVAHEGKSLSAEDFAKFGGDFKLSEGDEVLDLANGGVYKVVQSQDGLEFKKSFELEDREMVWDEASQKMLLLVNGNWEDVTERFMNGFGLDHMTERMTQSGDKSGVEISSTFDENEGRFVDVNDFVKYVIEKMKEKNKK